MSAPFDKQVDPQLLPLLEAFPDIPINGETLAGFRGAMVEMAPLPEPADHPDVKLTQISLAGPDGALDCLLFVPADKAPTGAMLHIHGGGYVMGIPAMDAPRNIALVEATGAAILSPDYRHAPEHPHPAALEDCYAALQWLGAQAGELGFAPEKLGVIGESAGGGLAASLALLARDRGGVPLAFQALIYPMLASPACEVPATARDPFIGKHIWPRHSNAFCWEALLGGGTGDATMPAAAAKDLTGLPPALVSVGELDLFVHDDLAYASRLIEAGAWCEAHVYPAAFHAFDRMADADVAQRFTDDLVRFLKRYVS